MRQLTPPTSVPAGRARATLPPRSVGLARAMFVVTAAVGWVTTADLAVAACAGPAISVMTSEAARGETVTVRGTGYGTNCYDTGPPPPGEGALGVPLDDIAVTFEQGGTQTRVARGAADATYGFEVDVVVPTRLQPGPATLLAFKNATDPQKGGSQPIAMTITDAPAPSGEPTGVNVFGPGRVAPPSDELEPAEDGGPALLIGAAAAAIVGAGAWFGFRRRR